MIADNKKLGSRTIFLLVLFYLSLIIISALSWSVKKYSQEIANRLYPSVYIDNIYFGGKTKEEVASYFNRQNRQLKKINLTVVYQEAAIATFSATSLNLRYDGQGLADRAYLIGRSSNLPSQLYQKIATLLHWQRFDFESTIEYDRSPLMEFINGSQEKYNKQAKNALFKFANGKVVSFRQEEKGIEIEAEQFLSDLHQSTQSLKNKVENKSIILVSRIIEPEITLAQANTLGIEELIAFGKSDFRHSIPERTHNIVLAASKFNGVLISKGKVFSFNETVGDISSLTGYKPAYIIKGGKTVLGDGGGVCQVSTTLFRAALNAGLPIIERVAHAYRVGYYENDSKPGFDATVFAPTADLKIKNDTPAYILIQTEVDQKNHLLYFRLYGKKDGRRTEISAYQMWAATPPLPDLRQDDPTLKKGVVKQVDFAAWGAKVNYQYKVLRNGTILFEKSFFSSYRPWQAVYLVGTAD